MNQVLRNRTAAVQQTLPQDFRRHLNGNSAPISSEGVKSVSYRSAGSRGNPAC